MRDVGERARTARAAAEAAVSCLSSCKGRCFEWDLVAQLSADLLRGAESARQCSWRRLLLLRDQQGARSRAATLSRALFEECARVRTAVRSRFRGPKGAALRRDLGEGVPANERKPLKTLVLAEKIAAAAVSDALRDAGVKPSAVEKIKKKRDALKACRARLAASRVAVRAATAALDAAGRALSENLTSLSEAASAASGSRSRSKEAACACGLGCVAAAQKVARLAARAAAASSRSKNPSRAKP